MEGDYLELSQFPYNPHPFPYNSHQSPLGTTGFLTSGIRAVDLETGEYDQQEILKMVNEVLEKVKAFDRISWGYFKEIQGFGWI